MTKTGAKVLENGDLRDESSSTERNATHMEDSVPQNGPDPEKAARPDLTTIIAIAFLGTSCIAPISLGQIVIAAVLGNVGTALGDVADIGWVIGAWSIASSVTFSLAGSLSDIFGRRYVIMAGQLVGLIGSIIASVAQTVPTLIGGSALLGAACGLVLVSFAAIPELLPNRYRNIGLAYNEIALHFPWVTICVLVANLLVIHATWRWIYYAAIIYSAVSLVGTGLFYFPPSRPNLDQRSRWREVRELDFIAIILYAGGLTSFLLGVSWGGSRYPWSSAKVLSPLIIGLVSFIAAFGYDFVFRDQTKHTLFPRDLLVRYREYTVTLVVLFVSGMVYYSMAALIPEATVRVYTHEPIQIGITLLPFGVGQTFGACVVTMFIHMTKHPKRYILGGLTVQTLFTGLNAYGISSNRAVWMGFTFFSSGCFALITVSTILNASLHVNPTGLGIAVGLLGTFRSLGGSVGNAVFGSILSSTVNHELPRQINAAATSNGYTGSLSDLVSATVLFESGVPTAFEGIDGLTPSLQTAVLGAFRSSYQEAFRMVFYSSIPFGVVAIIAALFIKDSSHKFTNHTQVHLRKGA